MPHSFSNPLQLSRTALAVMLAFGTLHAQAVDNAPTHYSEHDEKAAIGTAPQPAPAKKLLKSGALKTIGFIDDEPVVNSLTGPLHGGVKFAQTHTIDPAGNSAKEMPTLITDRGALLMFIPQDKNAERKSVKVTATLDGKELGTLEMAPPAKFPENDQTNFSSGYKVEYSQRAWSVDLPWQWMKKGLSLHFSDNNHQQGELAADKIEFSGASEYAIQFLRIGILTHPVPATYAEEHPEQAAFDYFQKVPAAKLRFGYYLPVQLDKVIMPDGKTYTTHSDQTSNVYGADLNKEVAFVTLATGINLADLGDTNWNGDNHWWNAQFGYKQTVAMSSAGQYANGRVVHGLHSWSQGVQLYSTSGNEASHEWGHQFDLDDYDGGHWGAHNQHSGWGYDAFYDRMIGNLDWGSSATTTLGGVTTQPYRGLFKWDQDAMSGGWAAGSISKYTLYTGHSAKRIQQHLNGKPILDPDSKTGYGIWNQTAQRYDAYSHSWVSKKAVQTDVPVITLVGMLDPEIKLPSIVYPPLFGSLGNVFNLPKPNESAANACWLNVHYPDHDLKVDLRATRYRKNLLNYFAVNVPMEPL